MIEVQNLAVSFGNDTAVKQVVKNVSFASQKARHWALSVNPAAENPPYCDSWRALTATGPGACALPASRSTKPVPGSKCCSRKWCFKTPLVLFIRATASAGFWQSRASDEMG
ncbi:hypothetical protein SODG_004833 [Sodalis praecaptivus]